MSASNARAPGDLPRASAAPPAPRSPWRIDLYALACALAPLVLLARMLGAPIGQPVADDFAFIHRALIAHSGSWLDGFGSPLYWRPVSRQVYFGLLARTMLAWPLAVALLQAALLGLATWLVYRALRPRWGAPFAAAAATFPALAEASRTLIAWPSGFQDLGALLFMALALHEMSRSHMRTMLAALLASLLCKEVGAVAAILLPLMPAGTLLFGATRARVDPVPADAAPSPAPPPPTLRRRFGTLAAVVALLFVWGDVYFLARKQGGVIFAHELPARGAAATTSLLARGAVTLWRTFGTAFSLDGAPGWLADSALALVLGLVLFAIAGFIFRAESRARLRTALPWIVWGGAWFLAAAAPLAEVIPDWAPYRAVFASLGVGFVLVPLVAASRPALVAVLAALRVATLLLAPGAPATVSADTAPSAVLDFPKLVRLERYVAETRRVLAERAPALPRGARVGVHNRPLMAEYAFAGDRSLETWYRDSTLRWVPWDSLRTHSDQPLAAIVEYEPRGKPQMAMIEPEAMDHFLLALGALDHNEWNDALAELSRAESAQHDHSAAGFFGGIEGNRALCALGIGDAALAEQHARSALALWPESGDARYVLGTVLVYTGRLDEAQLHCDTLLALYPDDHSAHALREWIAEARKPQAGAPKH